MGYGLGNGVVGLGCFDGKVGTSPWIVLLAPKHMIVKQTTVHKVRRHLAQTRPITESVS